MRRPAWIAFGAVALASVVGCGGSLRDVSTAHASGQETARVYAAAPDDAYKAAIEVMHAEEADKPLEEHAAERSAIGTRTSSVIPFRYGAFVGVWVTPEGSGSRVAVVTKRTESTGPIGVTEEGFHTELAKRLAAGATAAK